VLRAGLLRFKQSRAAGLSLDKIVAETQAAIQEANGLEVPILERLSPRAWLEMNPRDARKLDLRSHDSVDVISRRGRVRGVELRLTEITAPGQVFMPFHFFETNVNEITQGAFDPISREPNYKQCAVNVARSEAHRLGVNQ